jgi:hypothetical protein
MKAQFIVTIEGDWFINDKRITKRVCEKELRAAVNEWFADLANKVKVETLPQPDNWN